MVSEQELPELRFTGVLSLRNETEPHVPFKILSCPWSETKKKPVKLINRVFN